MNNESKNKLTLFSVIVLCSFFLFLGYLIGVVVTETETENKNTHKILPRTTILLTPDPQIGADIIWTDIPGTSGVHISMRYRVAPIGKTCLQEIGWIGGETR